MTVRWTLTCDAIHPERVPPECRAFVTFDMPSNSTVNAAINRIPSTGWSYDGQMRTICPSCARNMPPATGDHRPLGGGLCACGEPIRTT